MTILLSLLSGCVEHTGPANVDCIESVEHLALSEPTPWGTGSQLVDIDDAGTIAPSNSHWPTWSVSIDRAGVDATYIQYDAGCVASDTLRIDADASLLGPTSSLPGQYFLTVDASRASRVIASWNPGPTDSEWILAAVHESRPDLDTLHEIVVGVDFATNTATLRPQMVDVSADGGITQIQPEASADLTTAFAWMPAP